MRCLLLAVAVIIAAGCETTPELTATQWAAIETCEVNGARDDVLRAASAVVLDQGYFFAASDHDAGVLTGARVPGSQQDRFRRSRAMDSPVLFDSLCLWVPDTPGQATHARVQFCDAGRHVASRERVVMFWDAVQRRLLAIDAPPTVESQTGSPRQPKAPEGS